MPRKNHSPTKADLRKLVNVAKAIEDWGDEGLDSFQIYWRPQLGCLDVNLNAPPKSSLRPNLVRAVQEALDGC